MSTTAVSTNTLSIRPELLETIHRLAAIDIDRADLDALIDKVIGVNRELGFTLEETVNFYAARLLKAAFVAGWQACKNPEPLIFRDWSAGHD